MKNDNRYFVRWALGLLSSLCMAGVYGVFALARTVVSHEISIAEIRAKCGLPAAPVARTISSQQNYSIWSALGFYGPRISLEQKPRKESHEP